MATNPLDDLSDSELDEYVKSRKTKKSGRTYKVREYEMDESTFRRVFGVNDDESEEDESESDDESGKKDPPKKRRGFFD